MLLLSSLSHSPAHLTNYRADLIDEEGAPVPLASILSPISLAGCTCVDSTFSPEFVPVSDFSLTCHSMQITLIHIPPPDPGSTQYSTAIAIGIAIVV